MCGKVVYSSQAGPSLRADRGSEWVLDRPAPDNRPCKPVNCVRNLITDGDLHRMQIAHSPYANPKQAMIFSRHEY